MPRDKKPASKKTKSATSAAHRATNNSRQRSLKRPSYKSFSLQKKIKPPINKKLPSSKNLLKQTINLFASNKKFLLGVLAVSALLQLILVRGIIAQDFSLVKNIVTIDANGWVDTLLSSFALMPYLAASSGQAGDGQSSAYQSMLILISALAFIWAIRHALLDRVATAKTRIRDAYYKGMAPLVPFIQVVLVIALQFVPLVAGAWLYGAIVQAGGVAAGLTEQLVWAGVLSVLPLLSFYMMTSSVFALFIVTLPDMTALKALRSARSLVMHRRLSIVARLILPAGLMFITFVVVLLPFVMLLPALAPWILYILMILGFGFMVAYNYLIYRELIDNGQ